MTSPESAPGELRQRLRELRNPANRSACQNALREIYDMSARQRARWVQRNRGYHRLLEAEYGFWIAPGQRVLDVGCGLGDLLASLEPSHGVGLDLSPEMTRQARTRHPEPHLQFIPSSGEDFELQDEPFDVIILSDLLSELYDIGAFFRSLRRHCHARTRVIMNFHSRLWEPILGAAQSFGLAARRPLLNWVTAGDVECMLHLAGFEMVAHSRRILLPLRLPLIASLANRFLSQLWPLNHLCLTNVVVARPCERPFADDQEPVVSVVVACRNEAGHIPQLVERIPEMGGGTELIFVEGGSQDDTWARCQEAVAAHPEREIRCYQQGGKGKGDAVRLGFARASGEVLMILDADMTVPPEDLPQFYEALASGRAEFVNGSRLVYAMDPNAMRFLNLLGNKFFAAAFSFLLGQRLKDTLCGTKVLLRSDYERLAAGRAYFGHLDPFGDFDLIFGAAKLGLRIRDLPIRYRDRVYGDTNISRFRHGLLLLRMCWLALKRLKCR